MKQCNETPPIIRHAYDSSTDVMFGLERRLCSILLNKATCRLSPNQTSNRGLKNELIMSQSEPVDSSKIKTFLVDHGIPHKKGHACLTATCPKYRKGKLKLKAVDQLFINETTGYFLCLSCQKSGPWRMLQDNIGALTFSNIKNPSKYECFQNWSDVKHVEDVSDIVTKLLSTCTKEPENLDNFQQFIKEMNLEKITIKTLRHYKVEFLADEMGLVYPACDTTGTPVHAKIVRRTFAGKLDTETLPKRDYLGLFGFHVALNRNHVILTGSEADAMAVYQSTGVPAIALPRGITTLPQEILPFLEDFKKITLWFENSMIAFANVKQFANKLGAKRCLVVRPDKDSLGPHEALKSGKSLKDILHRATSIKNSHIIQFSDLRDEVKNELLCAPDVAGVPWTRFGKLTEILKGHRRGELTVLTGATGTGKTTFIGDYSLDLCMSGVNTLWGSFEISNVRLVKMMLQQFAQKNLAKHADEFDVWADQFESLPMYFMNFHGEESINKVVETMSHAVYVYDISHVIVDNLQFMMGAGDSRVDRFTRQDQIIAAFRKFATTMQCHVTLIVHPRKENEELLTTNSIFGSAKVTQEADNIIILQRLTTRDGVKTKYLQVSKNRFDGTLGMMKLRFNKETKSFYSAQRTPASNSSHSSLHSNPPSNNSNDDEIQW